MDGLLKGKRAIVTGAAQGIGRAVAQLYAEHGARVALLDISDDEAARAAREIEAETGLECFAFWVDVTRQDSVNQAFAQAQDALGGLDVVCNSAGILVRAPFLEYTAEQWERVFAVNARGAFYITQAAGNAMKDGGGKIVHISSCSSKKACPMEVGYGATKAAVNSLTRTAAYELGRYNINVNAICPGATDTAMTRNTFLADPETEKEWIDMTVLKRLSTPLDQARVALFLASELANHITGECLIVSAGELIGQ